ncbi:hypothetical protein HYPSUDRAFT_396381 [Hypholoma sublateritium FD-334 SS-4]|uniref:Uncharacterized protein n=1 Tax=Hypholoma sublateritium (strain FD-334 SS-4) TaxID=945553 RepID=A0A0D2NF00_HYPSF|nr:hypothetical protein HYPSUDRAFT_396381 [Hypholoma sublateritium FD-334 SS-4]
MMVMSLHDWLTVSIISCGVTGERWIQKCLTGITMQLLSSGRPYIPWTIEKLCTSQYRDNLNTIRLNVPTGWWDIHIRF